MIIAADNALIGNVILQSFWNASTMNLQGYWTEVHQIFTQCSKIIATVNTSIGTVIFQSVLEFHSDE